jgi:peptide/nickel transport system permease protein
VDVPGTLDYYVGVLQRMIMPVLALTLVHTGSMFLTARSAMAMALDEDYILLAHAKGVREMAVVFKHGFRNALLPIYTNMMVSLGYLVGGAMVIETVFSYPGLGSLIYESVLARDYHLLQGAFLLITISVLLANFLADLSYPLLDPRVRRPSASV